jgi:hypothetical protein
MSRLQLVEQTAQKIDWLDGMQTAISFAFATRGPDCIKYHGMRHAFLLNFGGVMRVKGKPLVDGRLSRPRQ